MSDDHILSHELRALAQALIVLDIDFFKHINDRYGHPVGDAVLVELAQCLRSWLSQRGEVGRLGGEEFAILLPATAVEVATGLAHELCRQVETHCFTCLSDNRITASFGVGWAEQGSSFEHIYQRVDDALYRAKRHGRNRVVMAS